jgi:HSP20 family protein
MALIRFPEFTDFRNPFQELSRVRREMDRLLSDLVSGSPSTIRSGVFPAVNVSEDANNIYVHAEIPGIKADGLDIAVEGNTVSLRLPKQNNCRLGRKSECLTLFPELS